MPIYYISATGNTKHFVNRMSHLFHNVSLHQIDNQTDLYLIRHKFFVFVPTYVKGVRISRTHSADYSSLSNKYFEEMNETLPMNEELHYLRNYKRCLGIIGSGNRNFGIDCYCLTARRYHDRYHIPLIADYELRGNVQEENIINSRMIAIWNKATHSTLHFHHQNSVNPRLAVLEKKYSQA